MKILLLQSGQESSFESTTTEGVFLSELQICLLSLGHEVTTLDFEAREDWTRPASEKVKAKRIGKIEEIATPSKWDLILCLSLSCELIQRVPNVWAERLIFIGGIVEQKSDFSKITNSVVLCFGENDLIAYIEADESLENATTLTPFEYSYESLKNITGVDERKHVEILPQSDHIPSPQSVDRIVQIIVGGPFIENGSKFKNSPVHQKIESADNVRKLMPNTPIRILDIGTGTGHFANNVRKDFDKVVFLDSSPYMLNFISHKEHDQILLGHAELIPVENSSIDLALCRLCAHHFINYGRFLSEVSRVLRPGGKLVLVDLHPPEGGSRPTMHEIEVLHDASHIKSRTDQEIDRYAADFNLIQLTCAHFDLFPEGVHLSKWCDFTGSTNSPQIKTILSNLSRTQRDDLGFHKIGDDFFHRVPTAQIVYQKQEGNNANR